jgi:hypothetical protein
MQTVFLSCVPSNGRPRELGTIVCDNGKNGIFIGYDEDKRVVIDFISAQKLVKSMDAKYEMQIVVTKKKRLVESVKEGILVVAQKILATSSTP